MTNNMLGRTENRPLSPCLPHRVNVGVRGGFLYLFRIFSTHTQNQPLYDPNFV